MAEALSTAAVNAATSAVVGLVDGGAAAGVLEVRDGVQPANPDTVASGTLLVSITLGDPAFGAPVNGVASLSGTPSGTAVAAGTATWFRVQDSDGNAVFDGACSDDGTGELDFDNLSIAVDQVVNLNSLDYTQPAS